MTKRILAILFLCFFVPAYGFAADSWEDELLHIPNTDVYIIEGSWDCGAGAATFSEQIDTPIQGYILAIETWPGTTGPTDNSDLALNTQHATTKANIIGSSGDNIIDNATDNFVLFTTPIPYAGNLTAVITNNSVNDAEGTIRIYVRRNP